MPTYHPSYVLRNGGENSPLKKDVWEDIKKVILRLGLRDDMPVHNEQQAAPISDFESLRDDKKTDEEVQGTLFK